MEICYANLNKLLKQKYAFLFAVDINVAFLIIIWIDCKLSNTNDIFNK